MDKTKSDNSPCLVLIDETLFGLTANERFIAYTNFIKPGLKINLDTLLNACVMYKRHIRKLPNVELSHIISDEKNLIVSCANDYEMEVFMPGYGKPINLCLDKSALLSDLDSIIARVEDLENQSCGVHDSINKHLSRILKDTNKLHSLIKNNSMKTL